MIRIAPLSQQTRLIDKRNVMLITMTFLIISSFFSSTQVKAIPEYSKDLPQSLKNNCNVCHTKASGGPINDFGRDYVRFGHNISAISELDSDGDGYENGEELAANTFPGDPTSFPAAQRKGLNMSLIYGLVGMTLIVVVVYRLTKG